MCTACDAVREEPTCAEPQVLIRQPYGFLCNAVCSQCPDGQKLTDRNSTACTACAPGTYRNTDASVLACLECAQDTIANTSGRSACTHCAFGTYAQASAHSTCLACELVSGGTPDALALTPRPSPAVLLFSDSSAQARAPRAKISPDQHCLAVLLGEVQIHDGRSQARVLVLGARSGARSEVQTLEGLGSLLDFAVTDAALYAVFASANVSVAKVPLDTYCRPSAAAESQHATPNLSACNGTSIAFAAATDAYVLLCGAENTSTVAGALALDTGVVLPWPGASMGVPRLVQFLPPDGVNTSFAVHYADAAGARLLTQNSTGAFLEQRALETHDDRDWAYAADAVRARAGTPERELLFLPGDYPRVAEVFANGSVRAWQLRGCFEYEMTSEVAFAHAALFGRADCRTAHQLVNISNGCYGADGTTALGTEFYVYGDLGYLKVAKCDTHKQKFSEAAQVLIFNNSSPQRKLCTQSIACEYGSQTVAGDVIECVCRAGFYRHAGTGTCKACDPGTFSNATEAEACIQCPAITPFSHRASTGARSCFTAYGIREEDPGVLEELRELADAVKPTQDTVAVYKQTSQELSATMSELRARLGA